MIWKKFHGGSQMKRRNPKRPPEDSVDEVLKAAYLVGYKKLTQAEAGIQLNCSTPTVNRLLSHARARGVYRDSPELILIEETRERLQRQLTGN